MNDLKVITLMYVSCNTTWCNTSITVDIKDHNNNYDEAKEYLKNKALNKGWIYSEEQCGNLCPHCADKLTRKDKE